MIHVVFCSRSRDQESMASLLGTNNICNLTQNDSFVFHGVYQNKQSLPKVYNKVLERLKDTDDIVVFVHDDVRIIDSDWITKITQALETNDIVGLAGGNNARITPPCLWHIMCPRETWSGEVSHIDDNSRKTFKTYFGKCGRVLILDGLFLAMKPKKVVSAGVKFDESNPCISHFYDIDFCLTCNQKKLKLSTVPIRAVHASPGLREFSQDFLNGQEWFLNNFKQGKYNA